MNNNLIVVGITGVARSGKDTIAQILCSRFGFTRIALADGLRSAFRDLDGPTWELTKDLESSGQSTRWALQTLGSECRRDIRCQRLWIHLLLAKIRYLHKYHPAPRTRFVVPDIRFKVEASELRHAISVSMGGRFDVWKALRDSAGLSGQLANHASETELDSIIVDLQVSNNSGLTELETVVSTYGRQLLEQP